MSATVETPLYQPFQDTCLLPHDEGTSFSASMSYLLQITRSHRAKVRQQMHAVFSIMPVMCVNGKHGPHCIIKDDLMIISDTHTHTHTHMHKLSQKLNWNSSVNLVTTHGLFFSSPNVQTSYEAHPGF